MGKNKFLRCFPRFGDQYCCGTCDVSDKDICIACTRNMCAILLLREGYSLQRAKEACDVCKWEKK